MTRQEEYEKTGRRCAVVKLDRSTPPDRLAFGDWVEVLEILDPLPNKLVKIGIAYQISSDSTLTGVTGNYLDGAICLWVEGMSGSGTFCKVKRVVSPRGNYPRIGVEAAQAQGMYHAAVAASVKDTNPKDAIGSRKLPYSCLPSAVSAAVSLAFLEGACKYGRHNYRVAGVRYSVYHDAARRHLDLAWEGQDIDPDSGLPHIDKAIACLFVLRDAQMNSKCTDDRPPAMANQNWMAELNTLAGQVLDRFPNPLPAYTNNQLMNEAT